MRRIVFAIFILCCLPTAAFAAKPPAPGDACGGGGVNANGFPMGVTNGWNMTSGVANGGLANGMFCNGSTWTGVISFQSTGNVGIGTASPGGTLDISSSSTSALLIHNTSGSAYLYEYSSGGSYGVIGAYYLGSGVRPLILEPSLSGGGKVGIGTASPAAVLDVTGEIRTTGNTLACSSTTAGAIRYNSSTTAFDYCGGATPAWTAFGGGSVTPAGSDQQVQLNNNGVLYASSGLTFNSSTGVLTSRNRIVVGGATAADTTSVFVSGGNGTATGDNNTAVGNTAMNNLTSGRYNTAIGQGALYSNTSGFYNVGIGASALVLDVTGAANTAVGTGAVGHATSGNNTGIGYNAGNTITSGASNVVIGYLAGNATIATGSSNILIGASTDTPASGTSNFLNIGNVIFASGMTGTVASPAGFVGIGTTSPLAALDVVGDIRYSGSLSDVSDRRAKLAIQALPSGQLHKIMQLAPVSFIMKNDPKQRTELGLIAQDVEPLYPDLVQTDSTGMKSMNYVALISPVIAAMQEQQQEIREDRAALIIAIGACGFLFWRTRRQG